MDVGDQADLLPFAFNDAAATEVYTLSLHDALPISRVRWVTETSMMFISPTPPMPSVSVPMKARSEEHTSELQSQFHLVCRLLLEKKKTRRYLQTPAHARRANLRRPPPCAAGTGVRC